MLKSLQFLNIVLHSLLQVQVGTNLEFTVGTLTYTDSTQTGDSTETAQPVGIIVGATVGGVAVAVLLTIAVVVIVALYRNKQTKEQKYSMYVCDLSECDKIYILCIALQNRFPWQDYHLLKQVCAVYIRGFRLHITTAVP